MDEIAVRGMRFSTVIGETGWEREREQEVVVDVSVSYDTRRAAETDSLSDTVDTRALFDATAGVVSAEEPVLMEALAQRIADRVLADFPVEQVSVAVRKTEGAGVEGADHTAVSITRSQEK